MGKLIFSYFKVLVMIFSTSCKREDSFRIVLLQDTQSYSEPFPEIFYAQTEWIAENSDSIAFVRHQGDITNNNVPVEWEVAVNTVELLEGKVPRVLCMGNHDIGTNGKADVRNTELFNSRFSYEKHSRDADSGGAFEEGKVANVWYTFKAGGNQWLVVSLEFGPRNKVLEWSSGVIEEHPTR